MEGNIESPLSSPTSVWNYLAGDSLSFYISHPKGSILFQAINRVDDDDPLKDLKADTVLLTIANRKSSENLIKRFDTTKAKLVIPLHYDNFFKKMKREGELDVLWGANIDEFKTSVSKKALSPQVIWPKYCDPVSL